jgi:hypothetical protein
MQEIKNLLETIEQFPPNLDDIIGKKGLFIRKEKEYWIGEVKAQHQAQNVWHTTKAKSIEELIASIAKQIEDSRIENFYPDLGD